MHRRRCNAALGVASVDLSGPYEPTPTVGAKLGQRLEQQILAGRGLRRKRRRKKRTAKPTSPTRPAPSTGAQMVTVELRSPPARETPRRT